MAALVLDTATAALLASTDTLLDQIFEEGAAGGDVSYGVLPGYPDFDDPLKEVLRNTYLQTFAALVQAQCGSTWTTPTLSGTWVNAATYLTVGYRKEGTRVYLRGALQSGTSGSTAFTLPTGFRPTAKVRLGGSGSAVVEITTAGVVTVTGTGITGLDGLSFAL